MFRSFLTTLYKEKSVVEKEKINTIIFCDPGLDDALMLIELLSSNQHNIVGVVPGAGNVPLTTTINNTLRICELTGRTDVNVYPGCKCPEGQTEAEMIDGTTVYGDDGLGGIDIPQPTQMKAETRDGIDFVVEQIKLGKVLLVSTGGLTDVYRVLKKLENENPDSLDNIIGISMMAGVMNAEQEANAPIGEHRFTEFNILFDPIASKGVFDISTRNHIQIFLAPLDLTHSLLCCKSDISDLENINTPVAHFSYALLKAIPGHYQNRFGKGPNGEYRQPLHDVHASACLLHPEMYYQSAAMVSVIEAGTEAGKMIVIPKEEGNVHMLSLPYSNRKSFLSNLINDIASYQPAIIADKVKISAAALIAREKQKIRDAMVQTSTDQIFNQPNSGVQSNV